jgi:plastocyanin
MRVSTRTLAALLIALLAPTGCGATKTVRERTGTFDVTLDDYLIRPQSIRVPKGQELTITVHNAGRLGHTFRIRAANHVVLAMTTIRPGDTRTSHPFKLKAGRYTMFCALSNHEELGMSGTLVVG